MMNGKFKKQHLFETGFSNINILFYFRIISVNLF